MTLFKSGTSWRDFENHLSLKPWFWFDRLVVVNRHMPSRVRSSRDSDARGYRIPPWLAVIQARKLRASNSIFKYVLPGIVTLIDCLQEVQKLCLYTPRSWSRKSNGNLISFVTFPILYLLAVEFWLNVRYAIRGGLLCFEFQEGWHCGCCA